MIENLQGKVIEKVEDAYYPPILDKDPVMAAQFLTELDSLRAYANMKRAYKSISSKPNELRILKDAILSTKANFLWFASFFKELGTIIKGVDNSKIPYSKIPPKRAYDRSVPEFQPPLEIHRSNENSLFISYKEIKIKSSDPVDKHRALYIRQGYTIEDFRNDFPAWYLLNETIVHESYNEKTNVRVRIDFVDGEFIYFIAGASDNWQQIMNVPLEMDSIVSSLLFRNSCQGYY